MVNTLHQFPQRVRCRHSFLNGDIGTMRTISAVLLACAALATSALQTTLTAWTPDAVSIDAVSSSALEAISIDTVQRVDLPDGLLWPSDKVLSLDLDLVFNADSPSVPALGAIAPARASIVLDSTEWASPSQVAPPAHTTDKAMLQAAADVLQHLVPSLADDAGPYFATESLLRELHTPAVLHASSQLRSGRVAVDAPQAVALHGPKLVHDAAVMDVDASEAWRVIPRTPPSGSGTPPLKWGGGLVAVPHNAAVLTATLDHTVDVPLRGVAGNSPQWSSLFAAPAAATASLAPLSLHLSAVRAEDGALRVRVTHVYMPVAHSNTLGVPASIFLANSAAVPKDVVTAVQRAASQSVQATLPAPLSVFGNVLGSGVDSHHGAFVVLCSSSQPEQACVTTSAAPAGSPAAPLRAPVAAGGVAAAEAQVRRAVTGPGLHREALYTVDAQLDAAALPGLAPGGQCFLALHQRLERTTYIDLDELREISRVGGPNFVSFTHYIDVERPTSASWQHEVLMTHPLPVVVGGANTDSQDAHHWTSPTAAGLAAAWLGSAAPKGAVDTFAPIGASPWASAAARSMMRSGVSRATDGAPWRLRAEVLVPFHVRYQSVGCGAGGAAISGGSELFVTPSPRNESTTLPLVQGCYGGVHLPLPTLHISCDGGAQWAPVRTQNTAWPSPGWCPAHVEKFEPFEGQLPGAAVSQSSCELTPPLRPVPVGVASHFSMVSSITAMCTLGASLLLMATGLQQSAPLRAGEGGAAEDTAAAPVPAPASNKKASRARSSGRKRKA